jgi:hypothetical protein
VLGFDVAAARGRRSIVPLLVSLIHVDGLSDAFEAAIGTDHANYDTDGDGVPDGFEVKFYGTGPHP